MFGPPFEETDTYLLLMARRAKKAVKALVSGEYLTHAPDFRASAWNTYAKIGPTHVIAGSQLVKGRSLRRAIWVVIAKTKKCLEELLKAGVVTSSFRLGGL